MKKEWKWSKGRRKYSRNEVGKGNCKGIKEKMDGRGQKKAEEGRWKREEEKGKRKEENKDCREEEGRN